MSWASETLLCPLHLNLCYTPPSQLFGGKRSLVITLIISVAGIVGANKVRHESNPWGSHLRIILIDHIWLKCLKIFWSNTTTNCNYEPWLGFRILNTISFLTLHAKFYCWYGNYSFFNQKSYFHKKNKKKTIKQIKTVN